MTLKRTRSLDQLDDFDTATLKVTMTIHSFLKDVTNVAKESDMTVSQVISAIVSASVTQLVYLTDCEHCVAGMLQEAVDQLDGTEDHQYRRQRNAAATEH